MKIQTIEIVSNNICYGPEPSLVDEVEQHLTIAASGEMKVTDEDGNVHSFNGSLCGGVYVGDIDLTYYLRKHIPVEGLIGFGD